MTTEKPSIRWMWLATNTPNAVRETAISSSRPMTSMTTSQVRRTPMSGARASMMVPWTVAMLAPPRVLPDTSEVRLTGATSISRRNPNSRSHTIEIAEDRAVDMTVMATIPGNRNFLKSNPAVEPTSVLIP